MAFDFYYKISVVSGLAIVFLIAAIFWSFPDNYLHLWSFDVGQGDSILIKTPNNHYFLIDGGPSDKVIEELSQALPFWQRKIDAVFVTHPHDDHLIGLIEVLRRYKVLRVFINPVKNPSPTWEAFFGVVREKNIPVRHFWQSEELIDKDLELIGIWPNLNQTTDYSKVDFNQVSMVLSLQWQNFRALLTGDSELGLDNPELEFYPWSAVDLLKVPHHGSKNALSQESLDKLKPKIAVISVGKDNEFRLPNQEFMDFLTQSGVLIWRTDDRGTLEVVSDGKGWKIK